MSHLADVLVERFFSAERQYGVFGTQLLAVTGMSSTGAPLLPKNSTFNKNPREIQYIQRNLKPFNRNYNNAVHDSPKRTSPNEKAVKVDQNTQILNSEEVIFLGLGCIKREQMSKSEFSLKKIG